MLIGENSWFITIVRCIARFTRETTLTCTIETPQSVHAGPVLAKPFPEIGTAFINICNIFRCFIILRQNTKYKNIKVILCIIQCIAI